MTRTRSPASRTTPSPSPMQGQGARRRQPDRRPHRPRPMREGDNDRRIVQLVGTYRVLSQKQLERLLGRSNSTLQRLLRRLYEHRYLERVFLPLASSGTSPALYILDRRGLQLLRGLGVGDVATPPAKTASGLFLAHTLAANQVRIEIALACAAQGWALARWLPEHHLKQDYDRVRIPGKSRPVALIPDGFFTIQTPDGRAAHFFLELDRGTEALGRFKEKVQAYVAAYKTGAYSRRYAGQGFRLLTVVDGAGPRRVRNLREATAQVAQVGQRFWFLHRKDVEASTVLTEPIWRVAGGPGRRALFDGSTRKR